MRKIRPKWRKYNDRCTYETRQRPYPIIIILKHDRIQGIFSGFKPSPLEIYLNFFLHPVQVRG